MIEVAPGRRRGRCRARPRAASSSSPQQPVLFVPAECLPERWEGTVTSYVVRDPGHDMADVVERPARETPEHHGIVRDGAAVRPHDEASWAHVRDASVRGLRRRYEGTVRQDEFCVRRDRRRFRLVVAVADGCRPGRSRTMPPWSRPVSGARSSRTG